MKSFLWLKTISTLSTVALPPPVGPPTGSFLTLPVSLGVLGAGM